MWYGRGSESAKCRKLPFQSLRIQRAFVAYCAVHSEMAMRVFGQLTMALKMPRCQMALGNVGVPAPGYLFVYGFWAVRKVSARIPVRLRPWALKRAIALHGDNVIQRRVARPSQVPWRPSIRHASARSNRECLRRHSLKARSRVTQFMQELAR